MATPGLNAGGQVFSNRRSYFIETKKLGILEFQLFSLVSGGPILSKRERKTEVRRFSRLLKDLKLVDPSDEIVGLSMGIRSDGEQGLFINVESSTKIQGNLPEELG